MKNLFSALRLPALVTLLACLLAPLASAATIVADFTGGLGTTDASHQFTGAVGEGWKTAWSTSQTNATVTPVIGANDWLTISVTAGPASARRSSLNRAYYSGASAVIDVTRAYTVSFSLTFDDLTGFTSSADYIGIFDSPSQQTGVAVGGTTNSWAFQITGNSKTIQWNNGNRDGGSAAFVSSGITVETGKVYTFTVDVDPATLSYTASITTDGNPVSTVTSTSLGFRSAATSLGDTGRYFHLNTLMDGPTDSWSYSLGGVTLSQIPEPRAAAFLGGLGTLLVAGIVLRRRRVIRT
ncbi:hypothetical protein OPIT5_07965 [Opitutaceae bacterium TAV5]|nr:hypothetical protein OPIT5_07965 [Opitutaceae bacterium TAV5]